MSDIYRAPWLDFQLPYVQILLHFNKWLYELFPRGLLFLSQLNSCMLLWYDNILETFLFFLFSCQCLLLLDYFALHALKRCCSTIISDLLVVCTRLLTKEEIRVQTQVLFNKSYVLLSALGYCPSCPPCTPLVNTHHVTALWYMIGFEFTDTTLSFALHQLVLEVFFFSMMTWGQTGRKNFQANDR